MISYLTSADMSIIAFIGVIFAFALTCIAIAKLNKFLPKDLGRQFAVDGKLSAGKPITVITVGSAVAMKKRRDSG